MSKMLNNMSQNTDTVVVSPWNRWFPVIISFITPNKMTHQYQHLYSWCYCNTVHLFTDIRIKKADIPTLQVSYIACKSVSKLQNLFTH